MICHYTLQTQTTAACVSMGTEFSICSIPLPFLQTICVLHTLLVYSPQASIRVTSGSYPARDQAAPSEFYHSSNCTPTTPSSCCCHEANDDPLTTGASPCDSPSGAHYSGPTAFHRLWRLKPSLQNLVSIS